MVLTGSNWNFKSLDRHMNFYILVGPERRLYLIGGWKPGLWEFRVCGVRYDEYKSNINQKQVRIIKSRRRIWQCIIYCSELRFLVKVIFDNFKSLHYNSERGGVWIINWSQPLRGCIYCVAFFPGWHPGYWRLTPPVSGMAIQSSPGGWSSNSPGFIRGKG